MKEKIMVSVIVQCYNHEKYIRQALDSIIMQNTDFNFEVIIHDDASTDNSAEIIREYEEKYPNIIRTIYQKENQFSKGVRIRKTFIDPILRGKYVAFCESDDYWSDMDKLQKQVDFLESNDAYVATAHNCVLVDEQGSNLNRIMDIYRPYRDHRYTLRRYGLGAAFPGQTATLVARKSAYLFSSKEEELDFNAMRITTGDKRIYLKLLLEGDIYCFGDVMSAHRVVIKGGDSWSARNFGRNLSFDRHAASLDMRHYIKRKYGKVFPNYYTSFHTGVACVGKYFMNRTENNRHVMNLFFKEHGGIVGGCVNLLVMGVVSIPYYFMSKAEIVRYDPQ